MGSGHGMAVVGTLLWCSYVGGWTHTILICWRVFSPSLQSVRCVDSWPARGAHDAGMSGTVLGEVQCVHVCVCICGVIG